MRSEKQMLLTRCIPVVIVCFCTGLLVGCTKKSIEPKDTAGIWTEHQKPSQIANSHPLSYIEFSIDGKFKAHDLPRRFLDLSIQHDDDTIDGTGRWHIDMVGAYRAVKLSFDPGQGHQYGYDVPLLISTAGEQVTLFFWLGEEAEGRFEFDKTS